MTDFTVRAVMTADAKGLVGAAKEGTDALNQVKGAARGVADVSTNARDAAGSIGSGLAAMGKNSKAAGDALHFSHQQVQLLTFSGRHFFEALNAGIPITTIMATQVLHLSAAFTSLNDVMKLVRFVTPWVGVAGLTAGIGFLIYQMAHADDVEKSWIETTVGAGRFVGATTGQLEALAHAAANANHLSNSAARDIAQNFVKTGTVQAGQIADLEKLTARYAKATGKSVTDAGAALAKAFADPAKAGEDLLNNMLLLDGATKRQIETMIQQGRTTAAQEVLEGKLSAAVKNAADRTSDWEGKLKDVGAAWDWLMGKMGHTQLPANTQDNLLKQYKSELDFAQKSNYFGQKDSRIGWLQSKVREIETGMKTDREQTKRDHDDAQRAQDTQRIYSLSDQHNPYTAQVRQLANERKFLTDQISSGKLGAKDLAEAQRALAGVDRDAALAAKQHAEQELKLNDTLRERQQRIKSLIAAAPQLLAQSAQDVQHARDQLSIAGLGAVAQQRLNDQYDLEKKTLPHIIALQYAHGAQADTLRHIIQGLTQDFRDQRAAEAAAAAEGDTLDRLKKLGGAYQDAIDDADRWRSETLAGLDRNKEGYAQFASAVETVFAGMKRDAEDFNQSFSGGITNAINKIDDRLGQWGDRARSIMQDFDRTGEDAFVQWSLHGQKSTKQLIDFMLEQFVRLAYEKYLAQSFNTVAGGIFDAFGSALGLGGGVQTVTVTPMVSHGFHSGGIAGGPPTFTRAVDPSLFMNAPRYHDGGLLPGERAVIAKDDEGIFTPKQMDNANNLFMAALQRPIIVQAPGGGAGIPQFNVKIEDRVGVSVKSAKATQNASGGFDFNMIVDQAETKIADRMWQGQSPVGNAIEGIYGAKRSPRG